MSFGYKAVTPIKLLNGVNAYKSGAISFKAQRLFQHTRFLRVTEVKIYYCPLRASRKPLCGSIIINKFKKDREVSE